MTEEYLAALSEDRRRELSRVNEPGLVSLRRYFSDGQATAFLGPRMSQPLYPPWPELARQLADAAADRLDSRAAAITALAGESPDEAVEAIRRTIGGAAWRDMLRDVLRVRTDPESGRSWTPLQELTCRCAFRGVVTSNYDPGIVDARLRVRPASSATGYTTWEDELGLDRWRTGDVFGDADPPVLFAHGQHSRPDSVVLSTTDYRRAYAGKLSRVLAGLLETGHLVWIGFGLADRMIASILREIVVQTGVGPYPGYRIRHVAIMPWDPEEENPDLLAEQAELSYGAQAVLYPAPDGDHSALAKLLESLADARFPPVPELSPARWPGRSGKGADSGLDIVYPPG
jgi:hypothetical protein